MSRAARVPDAHGAVAAGWHWTDVVAWAWLAAGLVPDLRPGALAGRLVVQDPRPARRVPADPAAVRRAHRRGSRRCKVSRREC